jgi:outer membrane protein assembly factor BamB
MRRRLFLFFILISTLAVAGCKISGTITTGDGAGVEGVKVYLKGEGEEGMGSIEAITLADGTYTFEGFHHGNLTITPDPDNEEYDFVPPEETVAVNLFANAVVSFIAEERETEKDPDPSEISSVPWSTFQGNASHNGYVQVNLNPLEFEHIWTWPNPTNEPEPINSAAVGDEPVPINPVAAGDGKVFFTTAWESGLNVAIALDSDTGDEKWRYDFGDIDSVNPPAYANNTVYIQSGIGNDSYLWAFDAEQTTPLEEVVFKRESYLNRSFLFYAPTVYEQKVNDEVSSVDVYIGGEVSVGAGPYPSWYGGVYGFNFGGVDAAEQWRGPLPPFEQWTPAVNENYVIAYTGPYSYSGLEFDHLTVLNRIDGKVVISIPDEDFAGKPSDYFNIDLAPVLGEADNVVVINDGRLISFNLIDENIGWQIPKDKEVDEIDEEEKAGKHFSGQPSLANGFIYAVYKGYLHARNESDGAFEWEWQPPPGESIVRPMLVTDNLIFVSTESATYAIDLETRAEVWSYDAEGHLALGNDGILFIATSEGELHAISTVDASIDASLLQ